MSCSLVYGCAASYALCWKKQVQFYRLPMQIFCVHFLSKIFSNEANHFLLPFFVSVFISLCLYLHVILFSVGSSPLCVFNNIKLKYRQVVKYTTNFIRCKGAVIDYMFRPFFIRPSSGLAWRSKEELVQLRKVQKVHYLG